MADRPRQPTEIFSDGDSDNVEPRNSQNAQSEKQQNDKLLLNLFKVLEGSLAKDAGLASLATDKAKASH